MKVCSPTSDREGRALGERSCSPRTALNGIDGRLAAQARPRVQGRSSRTRRRRSAAVASRDGALEVLGRRDRADDWRRRGAALKAAVRGRHPAAVARRALRPSHSSVGASSESGRASATVRRQPARPACANDRRRAAARTRPQANSRQRSRHGSFVAETRIHRSRRRRSRRAHRDRRTGRRPSRPRARAPQPRGRARRNDLRPAAPIDAASPSVASAKSSRAGCAKADQRSSPAARGLQRARADRSRPAGRR